MKRREYLAAIATLMGVSGCVGEFDQNKNIQTMTQEEAKQAFTEVTKLEPPEIDPAIDAAARFVDEDAGIVFHAFDSIYTGSLQVTATPIELTDL